MCESKKYRRQNDYAPNLPTRLDLKRQTIIHHLILHYLYPLSKKYNYYNHIPILIVEVQMCGSVYNYKSLNKSVQLLCPFTFHLV